MQFHYRLQFDENGYPRMYFFSNCETSRRTIPLMMFSETHPEDIDTKLEDHLVDECRYLLMSRPIAPMVAQEKEIIFSDPLNQYKNNKGVIVRGF